jgi:hypothetical protein
MTLTTIINRYEKSHQAKNLSSFSHSAFCTSTATTHHTAMMYRIGGREEATNLAWKLPRQRLGSWPPWLVGACWQAYLPNKNTITTTQQRQSMHHDLNLNGCQQLPWCPTPGAAAYNSHPECCLIVVCSGAGSEAPWRSWDNGGRHGWWGMV